MGGGNKRCRRENSSYREQLKGGRHVRRAIKGVVRGTLLLAAASPLGCKIVRQGDRPVGACRRAMMPDVEWVRGLVVARRWWGAGESAAGHDSGETIHPVPPAPPLN